MSKKFEEDALGHMIPLAAISASPTNPRKHFDEAKLAELAASINSQGVLQPLLVRPKPKGPGRPAAGERYELVAGERRWRAAKLAGLVSVPAIVRELGDGQVLEIQYIENLQREDLDPIEEAEGYRLLMERHGYTAETLAEKLGKSKTYVYATSKLGALPEKIKEAVRSGQLPKATAELIARVPNPEARAKVGKDILHGSYYYGEQQPLSFRAAKRAIEEHYMVELKGAPFNRADADLLPRAGACTACPKMTGNNRVEFPDGRADVCTDPECYRLKLKAHREKLEERAKGEGLRLLSKSTSEELFRWGNHISYGGDYIDLGEPCGNDKRRRSWKSLIGEAVKEQTCVAFDKEDQPHYLVAKKVGLDALKALKDKDIRVHEGAAADNGDWRERQRLEARKRKLSQEAGRRALEQVAIRAAHMAEGIAGYTADVRAMLRLIAKHVAGGHKAEPVRRRRRIKDDHQLRVVLESLDAPEVLGFLSEIAAADTLGYYGDVEHLGKDGEALWSHFGIDPEAILGDVKTEAKAKAKGKKRVKLHQPETAR